MTGISIFDEAMSEIREAETVGGVVHALCCQPDTGLFASGYADSTGGSIGSTTTWIGPTYGWWPTYWPTTYEDKTARAFRVVKALMDAKAVNLRTIKQFVDLVDKVSQAL